MIKLFLSPAGRMGRRDFWIGIAGFVVFVVVMQLLMNEIGTTMYGFFLFLFYIVLVFQVLYSVYGKRLHDIGRSFWPLTGVITLTFLIFLGVALLYGAGEYITEFSKYDRKADIDPAEIERLRNEYLAHSEGGDKVISGLTYFVWAAFTLWLGLTKPEPKDNQYGKLASQD